MFKKIINKLFCGFLIVTSIQCMEQKNPPHALTELEQKFITAANTGEIATIKDCMARHVNINARPSSSGYSALFEACDRGRYDIALLLLQQKDIEVKLTNSAGTTPLHTVCTAHGKFTSSQSTELVRLLLAAGADANAEDMYHLTPLNYALELPSSEPVELLIAANAAMIERPNGLTLLQDATTKNIAHVRALLKSPKITLEDIRQALVFNNNCRSNLLKELKEKLFFKYIFCPFTSQSLQELCKISETPNKHLLSSRTLQKFDATHRQLQESYFKVSDPENAKMVADASKFNTAKKLMQEIKEHQEIYRALFDYYRTRQMLELANPPKNKQFSRLSELPSDTLKMITASAAQPEFLSKDDAKKITTPKPPTL